MKLVRLLLTLSVAGLFGCQLAPGERIVSVETQPLAMIATPALPTPTLTPRSLPSATLTSTPLPTSSPVPLRGAVLSPENIASAGAEELKFPAPGSGFYWPGGARLLLLQETSFLQVNLEPLAVGAEMTIDAPGNHLAASADGSRVLVQAGDGGLFMWDSLDRSRRPINFGVASFGNFSPDGTLIVLGSPEKIEVTLMDAGTLKVLKTLSGFTTAAPVYEAMLSPGNGRLLWYARAKIAWMDIQSGRMGPEYSYEDFIDGLAFSPDAKWLAVSAGGLLQVLSTQPQAAPDARDLINIPGQVLSPAAFSADGSLLAVGAGFKVLVWDTAEWKQIAELGQATSAVRQVGFSPDGRVLAVLDQENRLTIWRAR